jgi:DnaJ-class molecular chaperone
MADFYTKLGISEDASETDVKKAYRKLSLEFHPDRNKNADAQSKIQEINEAYETLRDADKRREYDMERKGGGGGGFPFPGFPGGGGFAFPGPGGGGFPFGNGGIRVHHGGGMPPDMNNIFEQFFSGQMGGPNQNGFRVFHNGRPVQQKPPPLEKLIPITLEKAFEGFSISIELENQNGKEKIDVTVPRGIENRECVVVSEKGNCFGDMKGDLHLIFDVAPHESFRREGIDIVCNKTISLKEALCGFLLEIPHLNGKMLRITNQNQCNVVKPGYRREVPGFGMTRGEHTGKMIIVFDILFPEAITQEQRTVLNETL